MKNLKKILCCSVTKSCPTLCDPINYSMPGFPVLHHLPEFAQTHVHWVSDVIQTSHTLLSPSPSAFNLSQHKALCFRWPKYWSFSFSISPSNEYSGLISFRMEWLDLLAVQGTLKSLLSSKASILWHSALFIVQLSHLYMTTGKTIALTRRTFVGKGMSLLFHELSTLVITLLPRSKRLLISWLQSPSAVILEPQKIACHCFHCFPIYLPWSHGNSPTFHLFPIAYLPSNDHTITHLYLLFIVSRALPRVNATRAGNTPCIVHEAQHLVSDIASCSLYTASIFLTLSTAFQSFWRWFCHMKVSVFCVFFCTKI